MVIGLPREQIATIHVTIAKSNGLLQQATDFVRQHGPLLSTKCVIDATQRISFGGQQERFDIFEGGVSPL